MLRFRPRWILRKGRPRVNASWTNSTSSIASLIYERPSTGFFRRLPGGNPRPREGFSLGCSDRDFQLSVCTTNYNCAHALDSHLSSVYDALSGLDFEYVVVDNFSKDDSLRILKSWAAKKSNMTVRPTCTDSRPFLSKPSIAGCFPDVNGSKQAAGEASTRMKTSISGFESPGSVP
ncbi:glycosyltransferase [Candidatus Bathyarchaeota archaeon]|nr:MAG: glycosyltransferase [Candidatus Bathyarchaeota archaeon]